MTTGSPTLAARLPRPRWADARLWVGLALLAVSVLLGVWILAAPADTVSVWRAARDLSVGSVPDVEKVEVNRSVAQDIYATADQGLQGVLVIPLHAGELLPRSALAVAGSQPTRHVSVAVDPSRLPFGLQAGDLVDVWLATDEQSARLVAASVRLVGEPVEAGFGGELAVELVVPEAEVGKVVDAAGRGPVSLVGVPVDSQVGEK